MTLFDAKAFDATVDGEKVTLVHLENEHIRASITNYGAIISQLFVKDNKGDWVDVVQGHDSIATLRACGEKYFGAAVGRVCNRIGFAKFTLDGKEFQLEANSGKHMLHGGPKGWTSRVWAIEKQSKTEVVLKLLSADGDQGFPGNCTAHCRYFLENGTFKIEFDAEVDKRCPVNITAHSFFNLSGHRGDYTGDTKIKVNGDKYIHLSSEFIADKVETVDELFDFRKERPIFTELAKKQETVNEQMVRALGYDHEYIINGQGYREHASAVHPVTGIKMTVYSDQPCCHLYTGNWLDGSITGKYAEKYHKQSAFCFESSGYNNACNRPDFPSAILSPGEKYHSQIDYKFEVVK